MLFKIPLTAVVEAETLTDAIYDLVQHMHEGVGMWRAAVTDYGIRITIDKGTPSSNRPVTVSTAPPTSPTHDTRLEQVRCPYTQTNRGDVYSMKPAACWRRCTLPAGHTAGHEMGKWVLS